MVSYEGLRERSSGGDATVVPTSAMRQGDFSAFLPAANQIYDPLTTRREGDRFVREPFPGKLIPQNRISPVATKVLDFVPQPTIPGAPFGLDNYAVELGAKNGYDQFLTKLDYRINAKNNVYFSYGRLPYQDTRDSYSYQLNLNRIQGRHQLKFGAEYRIYNENFMTPGSASGRYSFSKQFTQANPARSDDVSGDDGTTAWCGASPSTSPAQSPARCRG